MGGSCWRRWLRLAICPADGKEIEAYRKIMKQVWFAVLTGLLLTGSGCGKPGSQPGLSLDGPAGAAPLTVDNVSRKALRMEKALVQMLDGLKNPAGGAVSLDEGRVRALQQEVVELKEWARTLPGKPEEERRALEQAWGEAEARLRELARQILQSDAAAADLYGPVLNDLVQQVNAAQGRSS